MTTFGEVLTCKRFDSNLRARVEDYLKNWCGYHLSGDSITVYEGAIICHNISIDKGLAANYGKELGQNLKKMFGFEHLVLDGILVE